MLVISLNLLLRFVTLFILFVWWLYWAITEKKADVQIPKTKKEGSVVKQAFIRRMILRIVEGVMVLQVFGISLLPFYNAIIQIIGFFLVLIGFSIALSARKTLGSNWAHSYEYQVKKQQLLVMEGIYKTVRHPIYSGLCLVFIGGELVAQSYLFVVGILLFYSAYWQARAEEKLLTEHFGTIYKTYVLKSKMFIPYLW